MNEYELHERKKPVLTGHQKRTRHAVDEGRPGGHVDASKMTTRPMDKRQRVRIKRVNIMN